LGVFFDHGFMAFAASPWSPWHSSGLGHGCGQRRGDAGVATQEISMVSMVENMGLIVSPWNFPINRDLIWVNDG